MHPLHVDRREDGLWYATFETDDSTLSQSQTSPRWLRLSNRSRRPLRAVWAGCTRREFNIGYDCVGNPWGFDQSLSSQLLARLAAAWAPLRITLHPPESAGKC